MRDLMQLFQCHGETPESTDNLTFLLVAVYNLGHQQGIRKERHRRRVKQNSTDDLERQCYIDAVVRLLKKADLRKVDLVWTYASHLIKEVNGRAE